MVDYGYGDAVPDSEKYGYGDATPDSEKQQTNEYGYGYEEGDASKYGYGDASPDGSSDTRSRSNSGSRRSHRTRRGSIGNVSSHSNTDSGVPQRKMGRRSSMKQKGAPRRSSIGVRSEVALQLPGRSGPVRRRTSIGFSDYDEVKEVAPAKELTESPESLWFQDHEYGRIREKAIFITDLAASGSLDTQTQKKVCTRGLESHIDKEHVEEEQMVAWKSVFWEQYHQRQDGDFDDETVARLYEMASMASRARALQRAQADVQDAEKHTRGVRRTLRRHSLVM